MPACAAIPAAGASTRPRRAAWAARARWRGARATPRRPRRARQRLRRIGARRVIATELTRAWGLRHPVMAGPMARVGGGELAGAVSAAGGLGFIGVGMEDPAWIAAEAARARALAPRFGIGFIAFFLERRPELLQAALEQEPFVVSISFADPAPWVE